MMLAWSQVVGIVSVVHMRVRRVRIALIREVLWLYLRPSVFTLSVPALLPFLKDFSTSFISSASGGFSLMLKLEGLVLVQVLEVLRMFELGREW